MSSERPEHVSGQNATTIPNQSMKILKSQTVMAGDLDLFWPWNQHRLAGARCSNDKGVQFSASDRDGEPHGCPQAKARDLAGIRSRAIRPKGEV
jgi:hypothetical protein